MRPRTAEQHRPAQPDSCAYVVGDDGIRRLAQTHADAWIGLLLTHRRLTRELDTALEAEHGLSLSSLELLGRLAAADDQRLRLTALADATGLTLSRISRMVDSLEQRGLVERLACPGDGRAINAHLTVAGLTLARTAQESHLAHVRQRFLDHLAPDELATLATIFNRLAPGASRECSATPAD